MRKIYLDVAKIMACMAVIMQHNVSLDVEDGLWFIRYFYYYICRFAVPVFVMATGILMLGSERNITYSNIIKKYLPRVVFPFIGIVYVIEFTDALNMGTLHMGLLYEPLLHVFLNRVSVPYWYIYMAAGIYLVLPYIKKMVRDCSKRELEYFLLMFFTVRSIAPFLDLVLRGEYIMNLVNALQMSIFNGYIGYLVLGYYIDTYMKNISGKRFKAYIIINITSIILPLVIVWFGQGSVFDFKNWFSDIFSPNIIIFSVTFLLILKEVFKKRNDHDFTPVIKISQSTFGIYLLHVYMLQVFNLAGFIKSEEGAVWNIVLFSFVNFVICYIIVQILKKLIQLLRLPI